MHSQCIGLMHCTLGSLLKQCRGCALLTVGCFGELQSMGCSAESEVHFVEHTASCGEQGVWGELFCQCHLDCRHHHLPLLPPLYHHNLWHRHHHFSEKKITMKAKTITATLAIMNIAEIGCNRHKQRWCTFFEPKYFLAWRTRNLGLFWRTFCLSCYRLNQIDKYQVWS